MLALMLAAMPDLGQPALEDYVDGAFPVVAGAQQASAETAAGYVGVIAVGRARLAGRAYRPRRLVDVATALTKSGVLVTPDSRSLVAPVLRARSLAGEGLDEPVVLAQSQEYAAELASNDVQAAQRVGLDEGAHASGLEVHGWRKAVASSACSWCRAIAGNVYNHAEQIPFHDHDRCDVEPVLDDADDDYVFDDSDIPF